MTYFCFKTNNHWWLEASQRPSTVLGKRDLLPFTGLCTPNRCLTPSHQQPCQINRALFTDTWTQMTRCRYMAISSRCIEPACSPAFSNPAFSLAYPFSSPFQDKTSKVFYNNFLDYKSYFLSSVLLRIFCGPYLVNSIMTMT